MARPKTVALLREKAIGHGEAAIKRLVQLTETDYGDDPRMAAVVERACEALLDRIGLTPVNAEKAAAAEEAGEKAPPVMSSMSDEDLEREAAH